MSAFISGTGCVTALGSGPAEVLGRMLAGERVAATEVANPETGRKHLAAPVPATLTAHLAREPRLRRASALSLFAACAGKAALGDRVLSAEEKSRFAVVFGVSSGGVQYTRRFYEQVVKQGANAASPMLFPETVYNAPASHLAAMLGIDGATYTLVGDGTVGLQALRFGAQLLELGDASQVLVVAAEELDWIMMEAHRNWRLTTTGGPRGALLSEGAAAVLLSASGPVRLGSVAERPFSSRAEARESMRAAVRDVVTSAGAKSFDIIAGGANGTWVDPLIAAACEAELPGRAPATLSPHLHAGEAIGAGALLQVVLAAEMLKQSENHTALVAAMGWNQQAAAVMLDQA